MNYFSKKFSFTVISFLIDESVRGNSCARIPYFDFVSKSKLRIEVIHRNQTVTSSLKNLTRTDAAQLRISVHQFV